MTDPGRTQHRNLLTDAEVEQRVIEVQDV